MFQVLNHSPGQQVMLVLEVSDGYGGRADSLNTPTVDRIILPTLTLASNYPQNMTALDTGLYYYRFVLPTGASSVGTYLADVSYTDPVSALSITVGYQIVVQAVAGNFGLISPP